MPIPLVAPNFYFTWIFYLIHYSNKHICGLNGHKNNLNSFPSKQTSNYYKLDGEESYDRQFLFNCQSGVAWKKLFLYSKNCDLLESMDSIPAQCSARSLGAANQLVGLLVQSLLTSYCAFTDPGWPADCGENVVNGCTIQFFIQLKA